MVINRQIFIKGAVKDSFYFIEIQSYVFYVHPVYVCMKVQENSTLMNFDGLTNFICFKRNCVLANLRDINKTLEGSKIFVIGGISTLPDPFKWG